MVSQGMSWADRARTSASAAASANTASKPKLNGSTAVAFNGLASGASSTTSSHSLHSAHDHEQEHDQDEETPASSLAPSSTSADEPQPADGSHKAAHRLAAAPSVNVWALRKQQQQQQSASPASNKGAHTPPASTKTQQPLPSTSSSNSSSKPLSHSSSAEPATLQHSVPDAKASDTKSARPSMPPSDPWKAGQQATSIASSEASMTSPSVSGTSSLPTSRQQPEVDQSAWPSPDFARLSEKKKQAEQKQQQQHHQNEDDSAEGQAKAEKKKAKWIPIQTDITVKSSRPMKHGHLVAIQRKHVRHSDNSHNSRSGSSNTNQSGASGSSHQKLNSSDNRRRREWSMSSSNNTARNTSNRTSRPSTPSEHAQSQSFHQQQQHQQHNGLSSSTRSDTAASASHGPAQTSSDAGHSPRESTAILGQSLDQAPTSEAHSKSSSSHQRSASQSGSTPNSSNMSSPFIYQPSSASSTLARELMNHKELGHSSHGSSNPSLEGSHHPEHMHGPILPGSFMRRGRPNFSNSNSNKAGRGGGSFRNNDRPGYASRDYNSSRRPISPNTDRSRHPSSPTTASHEQMAAAYHPGTDYAYPPYQAAYYPMNSYYSGVPATFIPFQPVIEPYVDGPSGLPFERPHPNNPHMLVDPPLDASAYWVLGQIEFYLSENNLARDPFLRDQMDTEGWVDIAMLASFNRVKSLSTDLELIGSALTPSTVLETRPGQVRRRGDWFKWVMPNAKPSTTPKSSGAVDDETSSELPVPPTEHAVRRASVKSVDGQLPREEINMEALSLPSGLSPHSQPTFIIGGSEGPPKRHRSPSAKRSEPPGDTPAL